jgi:hypothetical protein
MIDSLNLYFIKGSKHEEKNSKTKTKFISKEN